MGDPEGEMGVAGIAGVDQLLGQVLVAALAG
jgi:hypothetical protein